MVYTFIKVNITRACTHAGSHSRCVRGLSAVLITAVCQAEQGQQIWNMCYVTPLSKEGGSDPALGRTGPFKTDEGRRQKFCEITSISQIGVCRFRCQGANTSELQRTSDPHFRENKFISQLRAPNTHIHILVNMSRNRRWGCGGTWAKNNSNNY